MIAVSTRSPSRSVLAAVACLTLLLAGACTSEGDSTGSTGSTAQPEQRGPAGTTVKDLDKYYGQSLTWSDCAPYATTEQTRQIFGSDQLQCTRAKVPLDYAEPDGKSISLGLLRTKATDQRHRIGSLLINPGGPGASGMEAAAALTLQGFTGTELAKRFDLVGFDPRGIGASEPQVNCFTDKERDRDRQESADVDITSAGVRKYEQEQREFATKCVEKTGKDMLANIGSRDVAKDMDVLRSALGDKKLSYVGFSYGTRLGSTYAEEFPDNVRALVLDGAVDPEQDSVSAVVDQGKGFQNAFDAFSRWCARRSDCPLGNDAAKATQNYRELVDPLIDKPLGLPDGRKLSYDDATTGTIQTLYSEQFWQLLGTALTQLKDQHNGQTLMNLADVYYERGSDGKYSTTQDASEAVRCVDDPRVTDKKVLLMAERRYQKAAPFLASGVPSSGALDSCAFWPVPNTSKPHLPKVSGLAPTLVISTTNDPATPYAAGVHLAKALGGRLLTFDGTQHTVFLQGKKCVDDAGSRYLIDLTLPDSGKRC